MAKLNPILQVRIESLESEIVSDVSEDHINGFTDGQDLVESEAAVNAASSDLSSVENAVNEMEQLHEAQEKNIQIMDGEISSVEGENLNNEAIMSEPLPADEDQAVEVIDEQIHNEEMVLESIATSLGFKSKFGSTATDKFYAGLGVRKSNKTRGVGMESRLAPTGTKKQKAIQAYKTHCEGIGDAIKKMSLVAWDGVKKLIQKIIEFLRNLFKKKNVFVRMHEDATARLNKVKSSIDKYKLVPFNELKIQETICMHCENIGDMINNIYTAIHYGSDVIVAVNSIDKGDTSPLRFGRIFELDYSLDSFKPLRFDSGVEFEKDPVTTGKYFLLGSSSDVIYIKDNVVSSTYFSNFKSKFDSIEDAIKRAEDMSGLDKREIVKWLEVLDKNTDILGKMVKDDSFQDMPEEVKKRIVMATRLIGAAGSSIITLISSYVGLVEAMRQ